MSSSRLSFITSVFLLTLFHPNLVLADALKGAWTRAVPAPTQRTEMAVAAVENKMYVVGGFNKPNLYNTLEFSINKEVEIHNTTSDT